MKAYKGYNPSRQDMANAREEQVRMLRPSPPSEFVKHPVTGIVGRREDVARDLASRTGAA